MSESFDKTTYFEFTGEDFAIGIEINSGTPLSFLVSLEEIINLSIANGRNILLHEIAEDIFHIQRKNNLFDRVDRIIPLMEDGELTYNILDGRWNGY